MLESIDTLFEEFDVLDPFADQDDIPTQRRNELVVRPYPTLVPCSVCGGHEVVTIEQMKTTHVPKCKTTRAKNIVWKDAGHYCADCNARRSTWIVLDRGDGTYIAKAAFDVSEIVVDLTNGWIVRSSVCGKHNVLSVSAVAGGMGLILTFNHPLLRHMDCPGWMQEKVKAEATKSIGGQLKLAFEKYAVEVRDVRALAIQRMAFSMHGKVPDDYLINPDEWPEYVVKDLMTYPALCAVWPQIARNYRYRTSLTGVMVNTDVPNWRTFYMSTDYDNDGRRIEKKVPRAVNATLNAITTAFPPTLARYIHLDRPVTTNVELMFRSVATRVMEGARGYVRLDNGVGGMENVDAKWCALMEATTARTIKKAFGLYARHRRVLGGENPSLRKVKDMCGFVDYLWDALAYIHGTSLVKAIDAAIDYHNDIARRRADEYARYSGISADLATIRPVIALPECTDKDVEWFRFLETAGDLYQDGSDMGHCVGGYAATACGCNGSRVCYIFSLRMVNGDRATAEVSWDGRVNQSRGPHNCENTASKRLRHVLESWLSKNEWEVQEVAGKKPEAPKPFVEIADPMEPAPAVARVPGLDYDDPFAE